MRRFDLLLPVDPELAIAQIVGNDEDAATLLEKARCIARRRVVVKRPRLAKPLGGQKPPACVTGKTTRYDIYPAT